MKETIEQQLIIVQHLDAEIEQAKTHFLLKNATKPLSLVLNFMKNVTRIAIANEKRIQALEERAGVES